jgi:hypothetical protein
LRPPLRGASCCACCCAGARRVTLLALWDGRSAGDAPGGTAHMVRIAREAGPVDVAAMDTATL